MDVAGTIQLIEAATKLIEALNALGVKVSGNPIDIVKLVEQLTQKPGA